VSESKARTTPAISKVSDLASTAQGERPEASSAADAAPSPHMVDRDLPDPMHMRLSGGETVRLRETQVFFDKVVIRSGEVGRALYPSSQAAAWVVHFARVGPKFRVIPEPLLEVVE
jgi:hypothetical protein